jgi:threonine/homoserine/homoserine lactone efflux protein
MNLLVALASLFSIWFLVVTVPGPNFVVVTQSSVSDSRRTGLMVALGVSAGASTWATAGLVGISALYEHAAWLYDTIRILGGLYIVYMGLRIILSNPHTAASDPGANRMPGNFFSHFQRGLFSSFSNPKTAAFFSSLFVIYFPPLAPAWFFLLTISMVFCVSIAWYSLVAYFFSTSKVQDAYNHSRKLFDKLTGSALVFLGARLLFSRSV